MRTFTVRTIRQACPWVNGIEAHLDSPTLDAPARGLLNLSGWIASCDEPIKEVWLACVGRKLSTAKVVPRPDVTGVYPDRKHVVGFEIAAVPLGLGDSEPLKLMLESGSGKRSLLFELELDYQLLPRRTPSAAASGIVFAPIAALPRSGTTFLSQLLHTSAAILGDDEYPYELRFGEQFVNDWLVNVQPWAHAAPADRRPEVTGPNYTAICNILNQAGAAGSQDALDLLAASGDYYLDMIARLYRLAANKPNGFVISEKIGLGVEIDLIAALGASVKPIFLIRDPRDALLSMRRFNDKRRVYEFHEARTKHFNEVVFQLAMDLLHLTRAYERWKGDKLLVRYEELVAQPQQTLQRVLDFIGVDAQRSGRDQLAAPASRPTLQQRVLNIMTAKGSPAVIPDVHITSSPGESVGRWRSDLTPSEIAFVNWYFAAFLQRFGFE